MILTITIENRPATKGRTLQLGHHGASSNVGNSRNVATAVTTTQVMTSESPLATNVNTTNSSQILSGCTNTSQIKQGFLELQIESFPEDALPQHKTKMESLFQITYNEIAGLCLDKYGRVLQNATLAEWEYINSTIPPVIKTWWNARVACDGCPGKYSHHAWIEFCSVPRATSPAHLQCTNIEKRPRTSLCRNGTG